MRVLIIEDDPMMHVILRHGLSGLDDAELDIVATGADGLRSAEEVTPGLVLLDFMLPDMTGEEVLEALRQRDDMRAVPIIFLTGAARDLDPEVLERHAVSGVISKPFDLTTLLREIEEALQTPPGRGSLPSIDEIRKVFLEEGEEAAEKLLEELASDSFDLEAARELAHLCAGRGGTLGFAAASERARELELLLDDDCVDLSAVTAAVLKLHDFFTESPETDDQVRRRDGDREPSYPKAVADALAGKRIAFAGCDEEEIELIAPVLERLDAFPRAVEMDDDRAFDNFDLIVARVHDDSAALPAAVVDAGKPLLLAGPHGVLAGVLGAPVHDLLIAPWSVEEFLLRVGRLLQGGRAPVPRRSSEREQPIVVVADDDTAITSLVAASLHGDGMECRIAANGKQALETVASELPDALVLDVNMPGLDGFEVLARLKANPATAGVPIVMLTARRREADIVRGFRLGVDDYMTKPFNPTELLARLARLIRGAH